MKIGDIVYFITDKEQQPYVITGYIVRESTTLWIVSNAGIEVYAYPCELSQSLTFL